MHPPEIGGVRPYLTHPRIRSLRALLGVTVAIQAVVLGVGWLATWTLAGRNAQATSAEADASRDRELAGEILAALGPPEQATPRTLLDLQELAERHDVSGRGTVAVVSRDGRLLVHPGLRVNPGLRSAVLEPTRFTHGASGEGSGFGIVAGGEPTEGVLHLPARHPMPSLGVPLAPLDATLFVSASRAPALAEGTSWRSGSVAAIIGAGGLLVAVITTAGLVFAVRNYGDVVTVARTELEREVETQILEATRNRDALIFGLAKLSDYRDNDTGLHLERIGAFAELVARALRERDPSRYPEITDDWIARLRLASSLHDIGKVGIPDAILLKPGRLTPRERQIMQRHTTMGGDTLLAIRNRLGHGDALIDMAIEIALGHHERWDGTGYPFGLLGDQIGLAARIVAIADFYDAITSQRPYKEAMPHEEAVRLVRELNGTQFDPAIAGLFLDIHHRFDEIRERLHRDEPVCDPSIARLVRELAEGEERRAA